MKILDFGCGTGNYIKEFQKRGFNDILGLDTSNKMREIASKKTHVTIYERFDDINERFNVILVIDVVHFIKNIKSLAKELYFKCMDNAVVAIVTQSYDQIKNRPYKDFFPSALEKDLERYHDIDTLIEDFRGVGFRLQERKIFKGGTQRKLGDDFLNKVKAKCFSMFELIDEDEFNDGIKKFEKALKDKRDGVLKYTYAGKTILLFSKNIIDT
jgi:SAM-dependent methyltransferase